MTWLSISICRLLRDDGCGMIVISSLIFNGLSNESPALLLVTVNPLPPIDLPLMPLLLDVELLLFLLSTDFFATVLCAEYTWFSNCLYMPNVAVHTVHLYDKCAGFSVILCSRDTWFNSFHWYIWNDKHCSGHWTRRSQNHFGGWKTYSSAYWASASIFAFVCCLLHRARYQTMRSEQMPFQALIGEKSELTLLTIQRRPIVNHFRVNLQFMNSISN